MRFMLAGCAGLWRASRKIGELTTRLEHEAHHDVLTGLPNRACFDRTLGYVLALARREHRRVAVLLLDLDGFKTINDRLGHDLGDLALVATADARMFEVKRAKKAGDPIPACGGCGVDLTVGSGR